MPNIPYNILTALKLSRDTNIEVIFRLGKVRMTRKGENIGEVIISGGLPYFKLGRTNHPSINANLGIEKDPVSH